MSSPSGMAVKLKRWMRVAGAVAVLALLPRPASAGTILLSGDSNITDLLGGANNNSLFFSNVLGSGDTVAVLDFTNPLPGAPSVTNTDLEVNAFYAAIAGVTSTLVSGAVSAAMLAGVDLFVVPLPDDSFSASEVLAISGFLTTGGTLFLLGENSSSVFTTANAALNQLLDDLESNLNLVPAFISPPGTITPDPFTQGIVGDLYMPAGSQVTGGTTLYTNSSGLGLLAREDSVSVPEPASMFLFGTALLGAGVRRWRRKRT